jgi:membrane protein
VSILSITLADEGRRTDVVDAIVDAIPLSDTEGRDEVQQAVDSVDTARGPIAAVSLVVTIWTASAMFGAIRSALNRVWGIEEHRPFFRAKLVDFAQISVLGAFMLGSIVLTGVLRVIREASVDHVGPLAGNNALWEIPPIVLPAAITFMTFVLLYHFVPAVRPSWQAALVGAAAATVLFEALKNGFAFYVANFNNYNVVYGSLAGVLLFLLNTYLASNILLVGAEIAHTTQRYRAGDLDALIYPATPGPTITEQAIRAVKGLFVRQE